MNRIAQLALLSALSACAPGTYVQNPISLSKTDKVALQETCAFLVDDASDLTCREQVFLLMLEAREEQRNRSHDLVTLLAEYPLSVLADGTIIRLERSLSEDYLEFD